MKKHLYIDAHTLPEEGKTFSGELDGSLFSLPKEQIRGAAPFIYDLYAQKFDTELLIRGSFSIPMEFVCVRSLTPFIQTIEVKDYSACIELTASQIDLIDTLREEIILHFPDYPRCDEGDEPMECNLDSRYLAVDKPTDDDVKQPPHDEAPSPWDALDGVVKDFPDTSST